MITKTTVAKSIAAQVVRLERKSESTLLLRDLAVSIALDAPTLFDAERFLDKCGFRGQGYDQMQATWVAVNGGHNVKR